MLKSVLLAGISALTTANAATYGNNWVTTRKDPSALAAQFPSPNTTLLSPAFLSPENIPAAFTNGTEGPTDDAELGTSPTTPPNNRPLTSPQTTTSAPLPRATRG